MVWKANWSPAPFDEPNSYAMPRRTFLIMLVCSKAAKSEGQHASVPAYQRISIAARRQHGEVAIGSMPQTQYPDTSLACNVLK